MGNNIFTCHLKITEDLVQISWMVGIFLFFEKQDLGGHVLYIFNDYVAEKHFMEGRKRNSSMLLLRVVEKFYTSLSHTRTHLKEKCLQAFFRGA